MSTVLPLAFLVLLGAWVWAHELRLVRRARRASLNLTTQKSTARASDVAGPQTTTR